MIRDSLGLFSDAQALSYTSGGVGISNISSDNWMDLGVYTDALGVTTSRDIAPGEPVYIQFRVTTAFLNAADANASFQAVVFIDTADPPLPANTSATYLPSSHPISNNVATLALGFANSLALGSTFSLPLTSPQGGALNADALVISRSLGKRFLRVAYSIRHSAASTTTGSIEAILVGQSSVRGPRPALGSYVDGIYPSSVDWGIS
jgi:hypothetical protein